MGPEPSELTKDLCEVTITAPDEEWLVALCHSLIDASLAASAHVVYPITSVFRWKGDVHEVTEARAFLRSRTSLVDEIAAYVVNRHPYETPNVTAVPLVGGNPGYLEWLHRETRPSGD
jgi:periplasmic divalent cation tolerance protein